MTHMRITKCCFWDCPREVQVRLMIAELLRQSYSEVVDEGQGRWCRLVVADLQQDSLPEGHLGTPYNRKLFVTWNHETNGRTIQILINRQYKEKHTLNSHTNTEKIRRVLKRKCDLGWSGIECLKEKRVYFLFISRRALMSVPLLG